jgi:hypothetical protein
MNDGNKIARARDGALDLLSFMSDQDSFSIMPFNSRVLRDEDPQPLSDYRPAAEQILSSLFPAAVARFTTHFRLPMNMYTASKSKTLRGSRLLWC